MPVFAYKALTNDGQTREGELRAEDQRSVVSQLQRNGLILLSASEISARQSSAPTASFAADRSAFGFGSRVTDKDILAMTRSLATLLSAGTPLDRSMDTMLRIGRSARVVELVRGIQVQLREGTSLADALATRPDVFSTFYVSLIRASEAGGDLTGGMDSLVNYLEHRQQVRQDVISALVYPIILVVVAILALILMLTFVVPQFEPMFADLGNALPLPTRLVLAFSDFLSNYFLMMVSGLLCTGFLLRRWVRRDNVRKSVDAFVLRLPVVGSLVRASETVRFSRSLGTLLQNGVSLLRGLELAKDTLANRTMRSAVSEAAIALKKGGRLSTAFQEQLTFPELALHMIMVGEESGNLDRMFLRIAEVFEEEVQVNTRRLLAILEPVMIIGLGITIGGIVMAILVGIISVNELPM